MSVSGTWYNESGSMMKIAVDGPLIMGTYHTAVGDANGIYQLIGSIDIDGNSAERGQAIAWVVVWTNDTKGSSHSITAWSGQYQIIDQVEEIETLWLLTSERLTENDWAATLVNKDLFTRHEPSKETIEKARKKRMPTHPI